MRSFTIMMNWLLTFSSPFSFFPCFFSTSTLNSFSDPIFTSRFCRRFFSLCRFTPMYFYFRKLRFRKSILNFPLQLFLYKSNSSPRSGYSLHWLRYHRKVFLCFHHSVSDLSSLRKRKSLRSSRNDRCFRHYPDTTSYHLHFQPVLYAGYRSIRFLTCR